MSNLPKDHNFENVLIKETCYPQVSIANVQKELLWRLHTKIFNAYLELSPRIENSSSTLMAEFDRIIIAMLCDKEDELVN